MKKKSEMVVKEKEYKFKEGFSIKPRRSPNGAFFAMGETHIHEEVVFDLYEKNRFIETYDTFEDAKNSGKNIFSKEYNN